MAALTTAIAKQMLDALQSQDGRAALDACRAALEQAATGGTPAPADDSPEASSAEGDDAGSESDGAEGVAPPKKATKARVQRLQRSHGFTRSEAVACIEAGCDPDVFLKIRNSSHEA